MRGSPCVSVLVQILAVIGSVDDQRPAQVGVSQKAREELARVPGQRVAIGIAIALPFQLAASEARPRTRVDDVRVAPLREVWEVERAICRVLVMHREMGADLVGDYEAGAVVREEFGERLAQRHIALDHGDIVELDEAVDLGELFCIHAVLKSTAGPLGIEIDRLQSRLLRISPERRSDPDVAAVGVARSGIAQGDVRTGAAIGDGRRNAEIGEGDAFTRGGQARGHARR